MIKLSALRIIFVMVLIDDNNVKKIMMICYEIFKRVWATWHGFDVTFLAMDRKNQLLLHSLLPWMPIVTGHRPGLHLGEKSGIPWHYILVKHMQDIPGKYEGVRAWVMVIDNHTVIFAEKKENLLFRTTWSLRIRVAHPCSSPLHRILLLGSNSTSLRTNYCQKVSFLAAITADWGMRASDAHWLLCGCNFMKALPMRATSSNVLTMFVSSFWKTFRCPKHQKKAHTLTTTRTHPHTPVHTDCTHFLF